MTWAVLSVVLTLADWLLIALLVPRIVGERRESAATLAWVLAIVFLPFLGALLYFAIGVTRLRWRRHRRRHARLLLKPGLQAVRERLAQLDPMRRCTVGVEDLALIRVAASLDAEAATVGNQVDLLIDGTATFAALTAAIEAARDHVHLEYYIWRPDATGTPLMDLLCRKARAGVEVRLLLDSVGSYWLKEACLEPLRTAGGKAAFFAPVNPFARRWSLNLRNHRKIVVVDGRVGFTGGVNVGDEYRGRDAALGNWRDTHLRMEGPVVAHLQEIFVEDWFYACKENLIAPRYFPEPERRGNAIAQILASGPDSSTQAIHRSVFAAVTTAKERVWMTTPYFVPDRAMLVALETAARRGVDVRILLPVESDSTLVLYAGRSFYRDLLAAGCHLYEYQDGMLHAKTTTVDGRWSSVGSANMDMRSFALNFEANAIVYGRELAAALDRQFEVDLHCARLAGTGVRSRRRQVLEATCRILAPLL